MKKVLLLTSLLAIGQTGMLSPAVAAASSASANPAVDLSFLYRDMVHFHRSTPENNALIYREFPLFRFFSSQGLSEAGRLIERNKKLKPESQDTEDDLSLKLYYDEVYARLKEEENPRAEKINELVNAEFFANPSMIQFVSMINNPTTIPEGIRIEYLKEVVDGVYRIITKLVEASLAQAS